MIRARLSYVAVMQCERGKTCQRRNIVKMLGSSVGRLGGPALDRTDAWTGSRTGGRTDVRTEGRMDGQTVSRPVVQAIGCAVGVGQPPGSSGGRMVRGAIGRTSGQLDSRCGGAAEVGQLIGQSAGRRTVGLNVGRAMSLPQ